MKNKSVFCIGDLHFPYHHVDTFAFLAAVKKKYKPDRVISIGDEVDGHSYSFHDPNPDLPAPGDELGKAKFYIQRLYKMFPKMDIIESNHGSLIYRKQQAAGLPMGLMKSYNQVYEVSKNWRWHMDLTLKLSNGAFCFFHHSKGGNILQVSQSMGMSVVSGHLHEKMGIQYWANSLGLYFAVQTGCLVDDHSMAMAYNKSNLKRPLLGSVILLNGHPRLLPMILNKNGRWIGTLP